MYNSNNDSRHRVRHQPGRNPVRKAAREPSNIYFIALMPTAVVGKEIISIKQTFAADYQAPRALLVAPHITLQAPFTARQGMEQELCESLVSFAVHMHPLELQLDGFGAVDVGRRQVLYVQVVKTRPVMSLHKQLVDFLRRQLGFSPLLARYGFNPHIAISFNDLPEGAFAMAREEYLEKRFKAAFTVNYLYLFRHNGQAWEILQKCRLGEI